MRDRVTERDERPRARVREERTRDREISEGGEIVSEAEREVERSRVREAEMQEEEGGRRWWCLEKKVNSEVEACDFCGESFHPTYACTYHPRYGNHHSSSYASPQPDFYMNLTEQELDQWIEQRDQEAEEEIKSILQKISANTMSAIPLESVEVNEVTPIEDYWSKPEEIIEVSIYELDISVAQNEANEAEKEIDVILERPEKPQKRSKEDQLLVLVTPPTLPCLLNLQRGWS
ncbi:hypothetical protein Sjap_015082 [Stephania japonica]|uniref:C2H2-type domain-containing protein n=1 Tax=Stephania japonica TaxID=461633 RepID=A0AAP0IIX4_9MAGN